MSTRPNLPPSMDVSPRRLWFGFAAAAAAWSVSGLLDVIFAWHACMGKELGNGMPGPVGMRVLLSIITFAALGVSVAGAMVSYRNWEMLSEKHDFIEAEGRGRRSYIALSGVLVSSVLGLGIIYFSIPIYILSLCQRAR